MTTMAVDTQTMPAMDASALNGSDTLNDVKDASLRFVSGLILPPPEIKCAYTTGQCLVVTDGNISQL